MTDLRVTILYGQRVIYDGPTPAQRRTDDDVRLLLAQAPQVYEANGSRPGRYHIGNYTVECREADVSMMRVPDTGLGLD